MRTSTAKSAAALLALAGLVTSRPSEASSSGVGTGNGAETSVPNALRLPDSGREWAGLAVTPDGKYVVLFSTTREVLELRQVGNDGRTLTSVQTITRNNGDSYLIRPGGVSFRREDSDGNHGELEVLVYTHQSYLEVGRDPNYADLISVYELKDGKLMLKPGPVLALPSAGVTREDMIKDQAFQVKGTGYRWAFDDKGQLQLQAPNNSAD